MSFVPSGPACTYYGVSDNTLRKWATEKKIEYFETKGGHRRYKLADLNIQEESVEELVIKKRNFIYARVSSIKQRGDLERQVQVLRRSYPDYELITDIGSGLNHKRTGFKKILDILFKGDIGEVVCAHKDRFIRFGYALFKFIFGKFNAQLTCMEDRKELSDEQELAEDLLAITTHFSAKFHGRRKYKVEQDNVFEEVKVQH